jgi:hypothetical protein
MGKPAQTGGRGELKSEAVVATSYLNRQNNTITDTTFDKGVSSTETRLVSISCQEDIYYGDQYDLNGTYRNLAGLASFIAGVLALAAAAASTVAASVLTYFSIGTAAATFYIPTHYVSAILTYMSWTPSDYDAPECSTNFSGDKFVVTETGGSSSTYYEGDYWDLSSFTNHNSSFATKVYSELYGYDAVTILGWYN